MTTPSNASQLTPNSERSLTRPPSSAPAEPAVPYSPPPDATPIVNLADDTLRQQAERQSRDMLITAEFQLKRRVSHPDGGDCPVEEILPQEKALRTEIDQDIGGGSLKHYRLPRWLRWIPRYVLCFDLGLLLYFFAGITDVNWASPLSLALAFALVLAAMITLLSYGFLAFTGDRLRIFKTKAGTIYRKELDGLTRTTFIIAVVVTAALASLMFLRIRAEVLDALGTQAQMTAGVIAVAVAVVSAAANFLVIVIHALDGSPQVTRLGSLSASVRRPVTKARRMQEKAAKRINR